MTTRTRSRSCTSSRPGPASAGPSSPSTHPDCSPRRDRVVSLRPDRLRDFAQHSRDVVVAAAVVGVVTGLAVALADRLTTDLLSWVRDWTDWLVVVGPVVKVVISYF